MTRDVLEDALEDALGYIKDEYILEAEEFIPVKKHKTPFRLKRNWGLLAAGLALILLVGIYELSVPDTENTSQSGIILYDGHSQKPAPTPSTTSESASSHGNEYDYMQPYRDRAIEYVGQELGSDVVATIKDKENPSIEIVPFLYNDIPVINSNYNHDGSFYGVTYHLNNQGSVTVWLDENGVVIGIVSIPVLKESE